MLTRVLGYKCRVCNENCKQGFEADRAGGLNYGLHRVNGVVCLHREEWSLVTCKCAYCSEPVKGKVPENLKEKFGLNDTDNVAEAMFS